MISSQSFSKNSAFKYFLALDEPVRFKALSSQRLETRNTFLCLMIKDRHVDTMIASENQGLALKNLAMNCSRGMKMRRANVNSQRHLSNLLSCAVMSSLKGFAGDSPLAGHVKRVLAADGQDAPHLNAAVVQNFERTLFKISGEELGVLSKEMNLLSRLPESESSKVTRLENSELNRQKSLPSHLNHSEGHALSPSALASRHVSSLSDHKDKDVLRGLVVISTDYDNRDAYRRNFAHYFDKSATREEPEHFCSRAIFYASADGPRRVYSLPPDLEGPSSSALSTKLNDLANKTAVYPPAVDQELASALLYVRNGGFASIFLKERGIAKILLPVKQTDRQEIFGMINLASCPYPLEYLFFCYYYERRFGKKSALIAGAMKRNPLFRDIPPATYRVINQTLNYAKFVTGERFSIFGESSDFGPIRETNRTLLCPITAKSDDYEGEWAAFKERMKQAKRCNFVDMLLKFNDSTLPKIASRKDSEDAEEWPDRKKFVFQPLPQVSFTPKVFKRPFLDLQACAKEFVARVPQKHA